MVQINLTQDKEDTDKGNPLNFSGTTNTNIFPLQFDPTLTPIKNLTNEQVLPYLLGKWVTHNSAI